MTNFEFKARLRNHTAIQQALAQHDIPRAAKIRQTDTYFNAPRGRLKLRNIDDEAAQLIFYQRPDHAEIKRSDYLMSPVDSPPALREVLSAAYGIRTVVEKTRELYWLPRRFGDHAGSAGPDFIRLHIDTVEGLGDFLEIEVIVQKGEPPEIAEREARAWLRDLGIVREDLLSHSYADLLEARVL